MQKIKQRDEFFQSYEYAETIATGETGDVVIIPGLPAGKNITVTLIAGANSGKIQYTTSMDSAVLAGTAVWQDWDNGVSSGSLTDVFVSVVSAIRGVSTSGEIKIEIKI